MEALKKLDASTIASVKHLPGGLGSLGAVLVRTGDTPPQSFIIKGTKEPENELMAQLLTETVASLTQKQTPPAWRAPALQFYPQGSEGSRAVLRAMSKFTSPEEKQQLSKLSQTAGLQLMEFAPGDSLYTMNAQMKAATLEEEKRAGGCGDGALIALGSVLVYDLLINNWDRIPLNDIWTNNGNANNLLFLLSDAKKQTDQKDTQATKGIQLVLIDQAVTAILHKTNRDKYLGSVSSLCRGARAAAGVAEPKEAKTAGGTVSGEEDKAVFEAAMKGVCVWLKTVTSVDVGPTGLAAISKGFQEALSLLCAAPAAGSMPFSKQVDRLGLQVLDMMADEPKKTAADKTAGTEAGGEFYCKVCAVDLKTAKKLEKHVASSLHKMQEAEKAQAETAATEGAKLPETGLLRSAVDFVQDVQKAMSGL
eukprot:gb/GEZN01005480.1/.p1 GENE.gb/GEZN01005480.1/~~gb/GEZN01005480.1/.p1  ORF type:complete len:422 (-),score=103.94 gb/GEZN01005480.1/:506-1771(-)